MPSALIAGKVNLFLDVVERRDDGYHEIVSVLAPLTRPADTVRLELTSSPGIEVVCAHPGVPEDERNLCWQAAAAFAERTGVAAQWRVGIDKQIPVAAGLGGGSADAACLLRLLNQAHDRPLAPGTLHSLATHLGADVPFFLDARPCLATGIGECLTPLPSATDVPLVLLNPRFPSPVAWAYEHWAQTPRPSAPAVEGLLTGLAQGDLGRIARQAWNALEFALCEKFPLVRMLLEFLNRAGCSAAHVCGSGPTVYGLCAAEQQQEVCRAAEAHFGSAVWTCATKIANSSVPG